MTMTQLPDDYGVLGSNETLTIRRALPGPIDRVWAYLTQCELRRQWLAAGDMEMKKGAEFELVWRNNELTDPPGQRPLGAAEEHRMQSEITEFDPPHKLAFTWTETGGVSIELEEKGDEVLLTLTQSHIPTRGRQVSISAGWHSHLDILGALLRGDEPEPFWNTWKRVRDQYNVYLPG
jgi:uncharacterized protein YndB with AHSA1/START domain